MPNNGVLFLMITLLFCQDINKYFWYQLNVNEEKLSGWSICAAA